MQNGEGKMQNRQEDETMMAQQMHSTSITLVVALLLIVGVGLAIVSVYVLFIDDAWIVDIAERLKITSKVPLSNFEALVITVAGSLCIAAFNCATSIKAAWDNPNKILHRSDLIFIYAFGVAAAILSSLLTFVLLRAGVAAGSGDMKIASIGSPDGSTGSDALATKLIYFLVGVGAGATRPEDIVKSAKDTATKVTQRVGQSLNKNVDSMRKEG